MDINDMTIREIEEALAAKRKKAADQRNAVPIIRKYYIRQRGRPNPFAQLYDPTCRVYRIECEVAEFRGS